MIKITKLLLCIAVLVSAHAHAKVTEFEEVFTGTVVKVGVIDPDNFDPDNLMGQSILSNGDVKLTLFYSLFDFTPSYFPGAGNFTRTDSMGSLSGNFSSYYSLPDYSLSGTPTPSVISGGIFDQDIRNSTLPNTGVYQYSWAYGKADGTVTEQGNVTLKINWTIRTPDPLPVPEPQSVFMFCFGLFVLRLLARPKGASNKMAANNQIGG